MLGILLMEVRAEMMAATTQPRKGEAHKLMPNADAIAA